MQLAAMAKEEDAFDGRLMEDGWTPLNLVPRRVSVSHPLGTCTRGAREWHLPLDAGSNQFIKGAKGAMGLV